MNENIRNITVKAYHTKRSTIVTSAITLPVLNLLHNVVINTIIIYISLKYCMDIITDFRKDNRPILRITGIILIITMTIELTVAVKLMADIPMTMITMVTQEIKVIQTDIPMTMNAMVTQEFRVIQTDQIRICIHHYISPMLFINSIFFYYNHHFNQVTKTSFLVVG